VIRYEISLQELEARVDQCKPRWRKSKAKFTRKFIQMGQFTGKSDSWGNIRPVFYDLQHGKCAYCERKLPGITHGGSEQAIDHHRPAKRIDEWPTQKPTVVINPTGYYWLAYDLANYVAACGSCNTGLKRNGFPIAGTRGAVAMDIPTLNALEKPLLIFPLGDTDENPEDMIKFEGITPMPKLLEADRRERALVTIQFFGLADPNRSELFRERFEVIEKIWICWKAISSSRDQAIRAEMEAIMQSVCSPQSAHSSCAGYFVALCYNNNKKAREVFEEAKAFFEPK
jgi:5-methylcytosine-specific restriction endonuclease McrA